MATTDIEFTQALKSLKEIVAKLESSDLSLEEGIALIEEGIQLHKVCKKKLEHAQLKITKLFEEEASISA